VNLVGASRLASERTRASLAGGPFVVLPSVEPLPAAEADLWIVPVQTAPEAVAALRGAPVIAHGPAAGLRTAFLAGCVDYLREPWTPAELVERAAAALARSSVVAIGGVRLDGANLTGPRGTAELTGHQAAALRLLAVRRGAVVDRTALAWALTGRPPAAGSRSVDVHVSALRAKLAAVAPAGGQPRIRAVRGRGYLLG
jgi:CheY-like chemotaxis protein